MNRRRWLIQIVLKSLAYRKGRSLLLLGVLAMASSLVTALGIVSSSMEARVAQELRKYGANLVIMPVSPTIVSGSGQLAFGTVSEPAYLSQKTVLDAVAAEGIGDCSLHLQGIITLSGTAVPAEGVDFAVIRRLYPWWQINGAWPAAGEAVIGSDLSARLKLKQGDTVQVKGVAGGGTLRIAAVISTGGDEDKFLFLPLDLLQGYLGVGASISQARLLTPVGRIAVAAQGEKLQKRLPGTLVREVRQVAKTSEGLLKKVQLLMALVTAVVLMASASSVASTMSLTVLERGKEIGLLKALGASRKGVLVIFSLEAATISIFGGAGGYLIGCAIAAFVMKKVFAAPPGFVPGFIGLSLAVSLLLALFGSISPLISVFRLDPVRSLRGE